MSETGPEPFALTRREFVNATIAAGVAAGFLPAEPLPDSVSPTAVKLVINGTEQTLNIEPRVTLLDALREYLHLTGTKKGCDHGQCGACTVLADGKRINSCLALAVSYEGQKITTIEGLAEADDLHPMQAAFIEHEGFQCGYCTPGQICSAVAVLDEAKRGVPSYVTRDVAQTGAIALTDDEIRERMSGNICRCGAYVGIVNAVRSQAGGSQA